MRGFRMLGVTVLGVFVLLVGRRSLGSELKLRFEKGERFDATIKMATETAAAGVPDGLGATKMDMTLLTELEITDVKEGALYSLAQTVRGVKAKGSIAGQAFHVELPETGSAPDGKQTGPSKDKPAEQTPDGAKKGDSEMDAVWEDFQKDEKASSAPDFDLAGMMREQFKELVGQTMTQEVDAYGKVLGANAMPGVGGLMGGMNESFLGVVVFEKGKDVKPGDTWLTRQEMPEELSPMMGGGNVMTITNTFKGFEDVDGTTCMRIESGYALGMQSRKGNNVAAGGAKTSEGGGNSPEGWDEFEGKPAPSSMEAAMSEMEMSFSGTGRTSLLLEKETCVPLRQNTDFQMKMHIGPTDATTTMTMSVEYRRKK